MDHQVIGTVISASALDPYITHRESKGDGGGGGGIHFGSDND